MADNVVWVYVENQDGKPHRVALELLAKARELGEAHAVVFGKGARAVAEVAGRHGAKKVYVHEDETYHQYLGSAASTLAHLIQQHQPALVLLGWTYDGRDIATRLSAKLNSGIWTDATDISFDGGQLAITVPALGATTIVTGTLVNEGTKLVMARAKAFDAAEVGGTAEIEDVTFTIPADAMQAQVVETVVQAAEGPKLEEAGIIVSGGRGLQAPENFKMLEELADLLGGAVGATRAVVDAGWKPYSFQIGQTGKTVKPSLYIAVGISGAIQHTVGMKGAKTIIAVNKDAEAPIFKYADFGVVGDVFKVIPQLTAEVRKRKGG